LIDDAEIDLADPRSDCCS